MPFSSNRLIQLGIAVFIALAFTTTLTHYLFFDIARVRTELYLAFVTLLVLLSALVDRTLGWLLPRFAGLGVRTRIGVIAGPLLFAAVLVFSRAVVPGTISATDGNSLELQAATLDTWGERRTGFEMHPVIDNAQSPSRIRLRLPGNLRWAGGTLRVYSTQPDWVIFSPEGKVYEGTDGVDVDFSADGPAGLIPLGMQTLDLHHNASQRIWHEREIEVSAATQYLVVDALQKGNNWYDRVWVSVEPLRGSLDGALAVADWLSMGAVLSLVTSCVALLISLATPGSLLQVSGQVLKTPFHSEYLLLKERAESLEKALAELQAERDALRSQLTTLESERDRIRHLTLSLQTEQNKFRQAEKERVALTRRPESWSDILKITRLSDSTRMRPGTFALLHHSGDGSGFGAVVDRTADFDLTHNGVYDPVQDEILLAGGAPASGHNVLVRYRGGEARWQVEPIEGQWLVGAAYDTVSLNPAARELYAGSRLRANSVRCLNLDNGEWQSLPQQPESVGFVPSEPSAEYFPDRDELVWLQKQRLGVWKRSTRSWSLVSMVLESLGVRGAIARYSPAERCVLILGGATTDTVPAAVSRAVYKYDARGVLTRLKDAPESVRIYPNRAVVSVDPVSGNLLVIQAVLGPDLTDFTGLVEFWEYNCSVDAWSKLDASQIPAPAGWWRENHPAGVLAIPVSKHGVLMFLSLAGARSTVFLYKGTGIADPTRADTT
jgi:hypothetical protein